MKRISGKKWLKANTNIYTYMIGNGMDGTKQAKMPYFQCGPTS